jgi:predicted phosphate transport protein (TIGR00153 family)
MFRGKKDKFNVLLANISSNLLESANYFADYKLNNEQDLKVFSEEMKKFETKGDTFVHQVITELNHVFITPIEREDILALAMSMDDVLDGYEETAGLFEMYSIAHFDEYMMKFIDALRNCAVEIDKAVGLLSTKTLPEIRQHAIKIKEYETICDGIWRKSTKNLFDVEKDPIKLIKLKDIYQGFENIADHCQNVANTLEQIIMKNA